MFKRMTIQARISVLLVALLVVAVILNVWWTTNSQMQQAEKEMLEKTQILSQEMQAVWDFIDINQKRIDTDANGEYNFKNIYCAIAGKSVASLFMQNNDYVIRFVSLNPRYSNAIADDFERAALEEFSADTAATEFYEITEYDERDVFRYTSPIYVKESCLTCHGEPAGEIDVTGHPKEGMKIGDLAGASSIVMPIDTYLSSIEQNILSQSIYFFLVLAFAIIVVFIAHTVLVGRPLKRLESTMVQMDSGNMNVSFEGTTSRGEIRELELKFQEMAERLQSLYDNLEQEVGERTQQLAEANKILEEQRIGLEEANKLLQSESDYKSDFLAIMSHEFRTPLTSILAFADIWEKNQGEMSEKDRESLGEIKENGQILLNMVNNILEVARIDFGKTEMHYELTDMVDLVSTVEGAMIPLAERRSIKLTTQVSADTPLIYADWEKLRRIIENLVSNAIKFTQRGGDIIIDVYNDRELEESGKGAGVVIEVRDTGIGIKEDDIPVVFEKFTQLDKSSYRRYSGSGLGLSVVKQLVEAHGGSIEVKSEPKKGSTFKVRIPSK